MALILISFSRDTYKKKKTYKFITLSFPEPGLELYFDVDGKPTVDSKGRAKNALLQSVLLHKR